MACLGLHRLLLSPFSLVLLASLLSTVPANNITFANNATIPGYPFNSTSNHTSPTGRVGSGVLFNACTFPVYYTLVHSADAKTLYGEDFDCNGVQTMLLPGQSFGHPFSHDPGYGVNIKVVKDVGTSPTQLEWTWVGSDKKTSFDLSRVDGAPFLDVGESLIPWGSEHDFKGNCHSATCQPGDDSCEEVYNSWDDDRTAMRDCGQGADIVLTVCSGSQPDARNIDAPNGFDNMRAVADMKRTRVMSSPDVSEPPSRQASSGSRSTAGAFSLLTVLVVATWYHA